MTAGRKSTSGRDDEAVVQFVERFATMLEEIGFARMAARSFAALLVTDSGRLTAAELSRALSVSPPAVSGAMRYLIQLNLVSREREPGSRRDVYRVHDDVWYQAITRREHVLVHWIDSLREGLDILGEETPAGQRLQESVAYVEFMQEEFSTLLVKWRKRRAELRTAEGGKSEGRDRMDER